MTSCPPPSLLPPSRACFKKLPRILSFNTMRYTFNMVTMMKEKVNTHFSFPLRLDMTPYTEDFLMGKGERKDGASSSTREGDSRKQGSGKLTKLRPLQVSGRTARPKRPRATSTT